MKHRCTRVFGVLVIVCWAGPALATLITDSEAAFSGIQGQGGWFYGFSNQSNRGRV